MLRRLAGWWQPWLALGLFGLLLHFVWEMLQVPFYEGMELADHWGAVLRCTRAALGDVLIGWVAYAFAAALARDPWWLTASHRWRPLTVLLGTGLLITGTLEWLNVYAWQRWAYSPDMPVVLGIGLTPLLQWLLLPVLTLWLARRHLGLADGRVR